MIAIGLSEDFLKYVVVVCGLFSRITFAHQPQPLFLAGPAKHHWIGRQACATEERLRRLHPPPGWSATRVQLPSWRRSGRRQGLRRR
ncbi:Protein of unknown function [Gryllus bimaculatus]|nr:Protein of unknown function [Gryllus bimaculatus]